FFQAEDGIRDFHVTGVQTCALPIWARPPPSSLQRRGKRGPRPQNEARTRPSRRSGLQSCSRTERQTSLCSVLPKAARARPPHGRSEERRVGKESRSGGPQKPEEGNA